MVSKMRKEKENFKFNSVLTISGLYDFKFPFLRSCKNHLTLKNFKNSYYEKL